MAIRIEKSSFIVSHGDAPKADDFGNWWFSDKRGWEFSHNGSFRDAASAAKSAFRNQAGCNHGRIFLGA